MSSKKSGTKSKAKSKPKAKAKAKPKAAPTPPNEADPRTTRPPGEPPHDNPTESKTTTGKAGHVPGDPDQKHPDDKKLAKAKPKPEKLDRPREPIISADQAEDSPEGGLHGGFDRVKAQMTGELVGAGGLSDRDRRNLPPEAENAGLQAGDVLGSGQPVDHAEEGSNTPQPQFDKHSKPRER